MNALLGLRIRFQRICERTTHSPRAAADGSDVDEMEVEAWVEAAEGSYFKAMDDAFVERATGLGISSGMILDLGSRLALAPMKILWREEGFLGIGVYRSLEMAERARRTAEEWNLNDRMFFQVGEPGHMKFKTGYFDLVISDGILHEFRDPVAVLREIERVTKPSGAVLIRDLVRPSRRRMSRHLAEHRAHYPVRLHDRFETAVRAGFTRTEVIALCQAAGIRRIRVTGDDTHVILERHGSNDPSSWVTEREKYL